MSGNDAKNFLKQIPNRKRRGMEHECEETSWWSNGCDDEEVEEVEETRAEEERELH